MKKLLVILLIALFCMSMLSGCAPKKEEPKEEAPVQESVQQVAPDSTQPVAESTTTTQPSGK